MPSQVQWSKLNEYLLQVGAFDELVPFCVNALERLGKVVSFDQGRVYLFDGDGRVFDEYLRGISKKNRAELTAQLPLDIHAAIIDRDGGFKTVVFDLDEKYL